MNWEKAKEKIEEHIVTAVLVLIASLCLIIWQAVPSEAWARIGAATPKRALAALIGLLLIALSTALAYIYSLHRRHKLNQSEIGHLKAEIESYKTRAGELNAQLEAARRENQALLIRHPSAPANIKLNQAISRLHSLNTNLPKGDIEEKYVTDYHSILSVIEKEANYDLTPFKISMAELQHQVTGRRVGPRLSRYDNEPAVSYSQQRYCDRPVFITQIHGATKFIEEVVQS